MRLESSVTTRSWIDKRSGGLSLGREDFSAGRYALCRYEHECDHARFGAIVDPVVNRPALDQDIDGFEVHNRAIKIHIDFARHDDRVVDRIGAVVAGRHTWAEANDADHRSVGNRGADFLS